jgi:hypothetical protein
MLLMFNIAGCAGAVIIGAAADACSRACQRADRGMHLILYHIYCTALCNGYTVKVVVIACRFFAQSVGVLNAAVDTPMTL